MALEELEETEGERTIRAQHRLKLHEIDAALHEIVMFRGIVTPAQHQHLKDANYAGLYDVATREDVIRIRHLPFASTPEEFMGVLEMATHIFQRASLTALIQQRNLHGEEVITTTAEDVGVQIRLNLEKMGLPMPEDLPRHRRLADGEWMSDELLATRDGTIAWDEPLHPAADRVNPIYEVTDGDDTQQLRLLEERHLLDGDEEPR